MHISVPLWFGDCDFCLRALEVFDLDVQNGLDRGIADTPKGNQHMAASVNCFDRAEMFQCDDIFGEWRRDEQGIRDAGGSVTKLDVSIEKSKKFRLHIDKHCISMQLSVMSYEIR